MGLELFDNPIEEEVHHIGNGFYKRYRFNNGYGASVVRFKVGNIYGSYTNNENEWELAIIHYEKEHELFIRNLKIQINTEYYLTSFNDPDRKLAYPEDILGHLTKEEIEINLQRIRNMPCNI